MLIFVIISGCVIFSYVILGVLVVSHGSKPAAHVNPWQPDVSIVIAVRNEAALLPLCLDSLVKLDYPATKFEIVIVNDNSTDGSEKIINFYSQKYENVKAIDLLNNEKTKPGKAGALLHAIDQSQGDVIFVTDADCRVPETWLRNLLGQFSSDIGLVGGFTVLEDARNSTLLFGRIQSCDWIFLSSVAAAAAAMGKPVSWVGNNIAFRRQTYLEVGGYYRLGNSLVEDFSLIKAIYSQTSWKCLFTATPQSMVMSQPARSFSRFYNQRKRWASAIFKVRPFGKWIMITAFLSHIIVLAAGLFVHPFCALTLFLITALVNFAILWQALARLNYCQSLFYFPLFQFYYFCYSLVLPFLLMFDRHVEWKGKNYSMRHNIQSESSLV